MRRSWCGYAVRTGGPHYWSPRPGSDRGSKEPRAVHDPCSEASAATRPTATTLGDRGLGSPDAIGRIDEEDGVLITAVSSTYDANLVAVISARDGLAGQEARGGR